MDPAAIDDEIDRAARVAVEQLTKVAKLVPPARSRPRMACAVCGADLSKDHSLFAHRESYRSGSTHRRWTFPDIVTPDGNWREEGACWGSYDIGWMDVDNSLHVPPDLNETCASCPVRAPCLEYAMAAEIRGGIWGGTTARQRRNLRKTSWKGTNSSPSRGPEFVTMRDG